MIYYRREGNPLLFLWKYSVLHTDRAESLGENDVDDMSAPQNVVDVFFSTFNDAKRPQLHEVLSSVRSIPHF